MGQRALTCEHSTRRPPSDSLCSDRIHGIELIVSGSSVFKSLAIGRFGFVFPTDR